MGDYMYRFGPACMVCGEECSGMGRCFVCNGALCFICASAKNGKHYCEAHTPAGAMDVLTDTLVKKPVVVSG